MVAESDTVAEPDVVAADVVVVGGGPTGLMLAAELTLAGADVLVVERREGRELVGSRAGGLHARTIEILDQRGVAERFVGAGQTHPAAWYAGIPLELSDFPTRHNYLLALWQNQFERVLTGWVEELGIPIRRGLAVTGFTQDSTGVDVTMSDGSTLRAAYLVGCDGGRSAVRKTAGIEFPGWDPSVSSLIAEVEMREPPAFGIRRDENGQHGIGPVDGGRRVRVVVSERYSGQRGEPTLADVRKALVGVWGTDFGAHNPGWISRFTDMTRQASSYRVGRVLIAGDAAHVHYPTGGQGLNIGVQDAVNLGWKLAQVVRGVSPRSLLDTYQAERHPVAAQVLRNTLAQTALLRSDARMDALRDSLTELLAMPEPRRRYAGMISGLAIRYDLAAGTGTGHPLVGHRMPDLDLVTATGPRRMFSHLAAARPVLLNLGEPGTCDLGPWASRVQLLDATYHGPWELPVLGAVPAPTAVLIRPDGHVAWVNDAALPGLTGEAHPGLAEALTTWCGPAAGSGCAGVRVRRGAGAQGCG